jgi:hypothetical protein
MNNADTTAAAATIGAMRHARPLAFRDRRSRAAAAATSRTHCSGVLSYWLLY